MPIPQTRKRARCLGELINETTYKSTTKRNQIMIHASVNAGPFLKTTQDLFNE